MSEAPAAGAFQSLPYVQKRTNGDGQGLASDFSEGG